MKHSALALLLAAVASAGDFDVPPPSDDWDTPNPDGEQVKAFFKTEFADSDPKATAEVRVMTYPLSDALAAKALDALARDWAPEVERLFPEPRTVAEGAAKLGDRDAWFRDVRTEAARLTWHVARAGKVIFVFHVIRTNKAIDDADLEKEIAAMRAGFRFLAKEEQAPPEGDPARPPKPPQVKDEPRATLEFKHWRFECVKPQGLVHVPPEKLNQAELDSHVVAKFEGKREQATIMVRIYAQSRSAQRFTIDELAAQKVKRFEEIFAEANRNAPRRDGTGKFPLAERAIFLELVGRRATVQTTRWILAQCRNDRQYQIEIAFSGGADGWEPTIRELLDGFRPGQ